MHKTRSERQNLDFSGIIRNILGQNHFPLAKVKILCISGRITPFYFVSLLY